MGDHNYVNNWPDHSKLLLSATHLERESKRGGRRDLTERGHTYGGQRQRKGRKRKREEGGGNNIWEERWLMGKVRGGELYNKDEK